VGTHVAIVVFSHAIEFIRDKGESNVIGSVEATDRFEERASDSSMSRRISREGRGKIRPHQIARWGSQGNKGRIANDGIVPVTRASWPRSGIGFANRSNRPPKIVVVFGFPDAHGGVRHCDIDQCEQAGEFERSEFRLVCDLNGDLIVQSWGGTQTRSPIIRPKSADKCLFGRALGRGMRTVAAKMLRFVVGGRVSGTGKGWRRWCFELDGKSVV